MHSVGTDGAFDRKVEDFDRQRTALFAALIEELGKASVEPATVDFSRVFKHSQSVLGKSDLQMSLLFKVSRPTIGRWKRGITAPHQMMRKAVFDVLLAEAKRSIVTLRQATRA